MLIVLSEMYGIGTDDRLRVLCEYGAETVSYMNATLRCVIEIVAR